MREHLSIEEVDRFTENCTDDTYLKWFESANDHMMSCKLCQQHLQKILVVDAISEKFAAKAFLGMSNELEQQRKSNKLKSILEKIGMSISLDSLQDIFSVSVIRGMEPGVAYTSLASNSVIQEKKSPMRMEWESEELRIYISPVESNITYMVHVEKRGNEKCMLLKEAEKIGEEACAVFKIDGNRGDYQITLLEIKNNF